MSETIDDFYKVPAVWHVPVELPRYPDLLSAQLLCARWINFALENRAIPSRLFSP